MPFFRRPPALPDEVRSALDLARDDVLAHAPTEDGWIVGTRHRVAIVRADLPVLVKDWSEVDGARLDADAATLTFSWVDGAPPTTLVLTDATRTALARVVHERVQSSVVHHETVALPGRRTVRVALRRGPDGTLFTQVIGTGDVDLTDPATASVVDAAEARVREAGGLA